MYISKNEINQFSYQDAVIKEVQLLPDCIQFVVEALIVEPHNSQNTNFTRSYAGDTEITFTSANIEKGVKDGYKYYDANDVLITEVPDKVLSGEDIHTLLSDMEGAYLYDIQIIPDEDRHYVVLGIECPSEEQNDINADSYQVKLSYDEVIYRWEQYMNRVQE